MPGLAPDWLFSLAYWKGEPLFPGLAKVTDVLVDSGAFTVHKSGGEMSVKNFVELAKKFGPNWGLLTLDVIGNAEKTQRNLDEINRLNLYPIPVLTQTAPISDAPALAAQGRGRLALAGGIARFPGGMKWAMRRFRNVRNACPDARLHGLGFVRWPQMFGTPLESVDASTFCGGQRFGAFFVFDRTRGVRRFPYNNFVAHKAANLPPELARFLRNCGVTEAIWRAGMSGSNSLLAYSSVYATLCMTAASRLHGIKVFMAGTIPSLVIVATVLIKHGRMDGSGFPYLQVKREVKILNDLWKRDPAAATRIIIDMHRPSGRGTDHTHPLITSQTRPVLKVKVRNA